MGLEEEVDDDDVYSVYGIDGWLNDKADPSYTDVYNRFIENNYVGILTEDEAIWHYKMISGMPPEMVTEWPVIDAITKKREELRKEADWSDDEAEFFFTHFMPYEPALKHAY